MKQKMRTTVVEPTVSFLVGKETFFSSPLTSLRNSVIEVHSFFTLAISSRSTRQSQSGRTAKARQAWQGH